MQEGFCGTARVFGCFGHCFGCFSYCGFGGLYVFVCPALSGFYDSWTGRGHGVWCWVEIGRELWLERSRIRSSQLIASCTVRQALANPKLVNSKFQDSTALQLKEKGEGRCAQHWAVAAASRHTAGSQFPFGPAVQDNYSSNSTLSMGHPGSSRDSRLQRNEASVPYQAWARIRAISLAMSGGSKKAEADSGSVLGSGPVALE